MKILIVDDEPLVRIGMKSIIKWEEYGYEIVGEAGDGLQALEMIKNLAPDITLVDIMMPKMDGLEVIKKAKESGYHGKFIILSCISEIGYLQQALRLGVSRYVLKSSVKPDEILEAVNEVTQELKKTRVFQGGLGEEFESLNEHFAFKEFLNLVWKKVIEKPASIQEKMKLFGFEATKKTYLLVATLREKTTVKSNRLYQIATLGKSLIGEKCVGCGFVNFEDHITFLFQENEDFVEEFTFRLTESAEQYFNSKLVMHGEIIDGETWNLYEMYQQCKWILYEEFLGNTSLEEKKKDQIQIPATEYSSYEKLSGTLEMIKKMLMQSKSISEAETKKIYFSAIEYVIFLFELNKEDVLENETDKLGLAELFDSMQSVEELHQLALQIMKKSYALAEKKGYHPYKDELTDTMIQYVYANLKRKISTKDVAEHVHFSIDYTCKYFKKKTQSNLMDYILKLKIFKSKKELLEGKSISGIAEEYGFSSDGHYIKTFKKYEMVTPSAYVKKKIDEKQQNDTI